MKYHIFDTLTEAESVEASISLSIGCVLVGTNAKTGLPAPDKQKTERWAVPYQIPDGRWIIPSIDDTGIDPSPEWWTSDGY